MKTGLVMIGSFLNPAVLRDIVKRFGGKLALNCEVLAGGVIEAGEEVKLVT